MHLENHSQIREDHEEASVDFERLPGPWKSHLDIQECLDWTLKPYFECKYHRYPGGAGGSLMASWRPHGDSQLMNKALERAEPFGARSWTSYSSRLVIRKRTIDYQTQLGEHLNC